MARSKREIDFYAIYHSKTGDFKIIEELPTVRKNGVLQRIVKVQFIDTGTVLTTQLNQALRCAVKDPYHPSVLGVGCLGIVANIPYTKKEYDMWYYMLNRCYNEKYSSYYLYGGAGYTVCNEWLCFENFIKDFPTIEGFYKYSSSMDDTKYCLNIKPGYNVFCKESCYLSDADTMIGNNIRLATKHENSSSKFYGVYKTASGSYQSSICINGMKYFLGTYSNEIAAASVYNYMAERCLYNPILNDRSIMMPVNEAFMYMTSRVPLTLPPNIKSELLNIPVNNMKEMCKIVK